MISIVSASWLIGAALAQPDATYLPKDHRAAARSCADVDYRPQLGPPRTMGDSAFCFAYSSAVLLSQRTGRDVSALDLATGFYLSAPAKFSERVAPVVRAELGDDFIARLAGETSRPGVDIDGKLAIFPHLEGGFEASTLAWANARGICEDRRLPSAGGTDAYARLNRRLTRAASHERLTAGPEVEGIAARFRGPVTDRFHTGWLRYTRDRCRARPAPVAVLPVDFALTGTSREFLRARREGRLDDDDQTRVFEVLDYALDHDRVAAIGFDLNTVQGHPGYVDDDGDHSVAIVGRRQTPAGCQYLVRDSAPDPCSDFAAAIRPRCDNHQYWLTEDELRRSLYSVTYLR